MGEMSQEPTTPNVEILPTKIAINIPRSACLTTCLYMSFMGLGLCANVLGPTLVHMEELLNTDTKSIGFAFFGGSVGYCLGSVFCGLLYDRFNPEIQLSIQAVLMGLTTAIAPWMPNLYAFIAAITIQNIVFCYLDTAGQSYVLRLWTDHRLKNPAMNAAHALWSVGATVAPIIASQFLIELPRDEDDDEKSRLNFTSSNMTTTLATEDQELENLERVRYPYLIVGVYTLLPALAFVGAFIARGSSCRPDQTTSTNEETGKKNTMTFQVTVLTLLALCFFFYIWYEAVPGNFLTTFAYKGLGWTEKNSALLTSVLWATHGCGRIIGIPMSGFLSPTTMISINLFFTTSGFALMVFVNSLPPVFTWLAVALTGLGMGSTFASMILWGSQHLEITGRASAVLLLGASAGGAVAGPFAGYMFQTFAPICIVYICFTACIVHVVLFAALNIFVRVYHSHPLPTDSHIDNKQHVHELEPLKTSTVTAAAAELSQTEASNFVQNSAAPTTSHT